MAVVGLTLLSIAACGTSSTPARSGLAAGPAVAGLRTGFDDQGGSSLGDYLAGQFALESGRLVEATSYFESALSGDPENDELQRQLFALNLAGGRYDVALAEAEHLATLPDPPEEAILLLALDEVRAGRFEAARTSLAGVGDEGVAGLTPPFLDAWARLGEGGPAALDDALARLDEAQALGPLNGYHRAMLLDRGGRLEEAAATLATAMPDSGPAPVRMVQSQASLLARRGQVDLAVAAVREQLSHGSADQPVLRDLLATLERGETPPPPIGSATDGMADALLGIAEALHQEHGALRAVVYAHLALFLRPELGEAWLLIGDVMSEQDNLDAAIEAYRAVPPEAPLGYLAQLRMARALHAMERDEEAYALLEQVATAHPDQTEPLVRLGDLLRRRERYEEAEDAYSRAVLRLAEPTREDWTLFYARGITYERTKRWPQAEADFLHALELEPEQPFVLNYLGYSWVDNGQNLDRARGMLHRAVELRPNDGFIVDSLGWVHYRLGEYDDAVDQLERAVELEPGDPVINDHLGDAYWRVGRVREARFQWRRALSLEPEDDVVAEIEEKLRSGLPAAPDRDRI